MPPQRALILRPCCLSQVMLATPLLAALSEAFPAARFDWLVSDWARPAISGNPRLAELISAGEGDLRQQNWRQIGQIAARIRAQGYDTAFIPGRSAWLSYLAWRAGIPQRVGLNVAGRGFAHTLDVRPPPGAQSAAASYLLLAREAGVSEELIAQANMEFYAADIDRTNVTRLLVEELDWLGDAPLVILHPGGGVNPVHAAPLKRWPAERFALLGNHLVRRYGARVILVGAQGEEPLTNTIRGLMASKAADYCGRVSLGEIGALCEVADLYVGNDAGPTHIAAASGCPTIAVFGPSDPAYSQPYSTRGNVVSVWRDLNEMEERPFTWEMGASVADVATAADQLLAQAAEGQHPFAFLTAVRR